MNHGDCLWTEGDSNLSPMVITCSLCREYSLVLYGCLLKRQFEGL